VALVAGAGGAGAGAAQEEVGPIALAGPPQLVRAPDLGGDRVAVVVRTSRPLGARAGGTLRGRVTLGGRRAWFQRMRVLHNSPCYVAYLRHRPPLRLGRRYRLTIVLEGDAHRRSATLRALPRRERRGAALAC
jgi:hypothetical protein